MESMKTHILWLLAADQSTADDITSNLEIDIEYIQTNDMSKDILHHVWFITHGHQNSVPLGLA